jgi:holo-[acyl-carrier protein] synthase
MHPLPLAVAPAAALPAVTDPLWRRILSPAELIRYGSRRRAGEHFTARALARLALASALGWPGEVPWQDVAIRKEPTGRPVVALSGRLAEWHRRNQVPVPGVSMSHAAGHAAALAWLPGHSLPVLGWDDVAVPAYAQPGVRP